MASTLVPPFLLFFHHFLEYSPMSIQRCLSSHPLPFSYSFFLFSLTWISQGSRGTTATRVKTTKLPIITSTLTDRYVHYSFHLAPSAFSKTLTHFYFHILLNTQAEWKILSSVCVLLSLYCSIWSSSTSPDNTQASDTHKHTNCT